MGSLQLHKACIKWRRCSRKSAIFLPNGSIILMKAREANDAQYHLLLPVRHCLADLQRRLSSHGMLQFCTVKKEPQICQTAVVVSHGDRKRKQNDQLMLAMRTRCAAPIQVLADALYRAVILGHTCDARQGHGRTSAGESPAAAGAAPAGPSPCAPCGC